MSEYIEPPEDVKEEVHEEIVDLLKDLAGGDEPSGYILAVSDSNEEVSTFVYGTESGLMRLFYGAQQDVVRVLGVRRKERE